MNTHLPKQQGTIAVEYLLLLILMGVFVISNFDSIEDAVGNAESSITSTLGDTQSAIPSVIVGDDGATGGGEEPPPEGGEGGGEEPPPPPPEGGEGGGEEPPPPPEGGGGGGEGGGEEPMQ